MKLKRIIAALVAVMISATNVLAKEQTFNDTDGHWAENIIEKWQDHGYINGYSDGSFKPDNPVTRAELAKILSAAFDLQKKEQLAYEDISDNEWYYPYLEKSARFIPVYPLPISYESNAPYSGNWSETNFLPEVNALRMHVAEALVKIKAEKENIEVSDLIGDLDIREINKQVMGFFKDPDFRLEVFMRDIAHNSARMSWYAWLAYNLDVMRGDADGYFYPYGYITRAELLAVVDRMTCETELTQIH